MRDQTFSGNHYHNDCKNKVKLAELFEWYLVCIDLEINFGSIAVFLYIVLVILERALKTGA